MTNSKLFVFFFVCNMKNLFHFWSESYARALIPTYFHLNPTNDMETIKQKVGSITNWTQNINYKILTLLDKICIEIHNNKGIPICINPTNKKKYCVRPWFEQNVSMCLFSQNERKHWPNRIHFPTKYADFHNQIKVDIMQSFAWFGGLASIPCFFCVNTLLLLLIWVFFSFFLLTQKKIVLMAMPLRFNCNKKKRALSWLSHKTKNTKKWLC